MLVTRARRLSLAASLVSSSINTQHKHRDLGDEITIDGRHEKLVSGLQDLSIPKGTREEIKQVTHIIEEMAR
jgi:hypothetical protein